MPAAARDARTGLIGPTIAATVCFAILVSLGVWQLQRLAWKEALIARIAARIHQPPAPLPPMTQWAGPKPAPQSNDTQTTNHNFCDSQPQVPRKKS